ncbi:MAG: protein kinase [Anaerolineae bacterium]|nr:protein kinase [Anaerolineae bacterium]
MDTLGDLTIDNRYQLLEQLGAGGMGTVYRAFDRLTQHHVALKRVHTFNDSESDTGSGFTNTRFALAHEFQTLASLHHPHIISVLDYGFDEDRDPYFTMTLLEKPRFFLNAAQGTSVEHKVDLLIQALEALAYTHRRGIIHRDLKPENILVTNEDEVKVLDFGLALLRNTRQDEDVLVGTFAYMAPEVLSGDAISQSADLYAIGMMAYEIFAGFHPFSRNNLNLLIQEILSKPVDTTDLNINSELAAIIQRLLHKEADGRYSSAHEVIADLSLAIDQPLPPESIEIRESFIKAAQFIGREAELAQLKSALAEALGGRGSVWLIGGESGVGKSRLLSEIRTHALVSGALVLQGQGVVEGGLAYHAWRSPLRRLALSTELSDFDAGVLKQIIPDIGDLLGRNIPDVAELEGQAGQQRLMQAVIDVLRHQQKPVVFILEDLQWMVESLDILRILIPLTESSPLLILGDYRNDERPNLPEELPGTHAIHLERLTDEGILQLSTSMLGEQGRQPELIALLKKETEGNIFFLVEVVRALAEVVGRLSDIGSTTLPDHVFAGGIQQVIERRLSRINTEDRYLLGLAAIAGRQLDLKLLAALSPSTTPAKWDDWLTTCTNAVVLDVMNEQWRFAHDKLREGILAGLTAEKRQMLHRQVAEALQKVYANALDDYAALISDHYEEAGDLLAAVPWLERAGKHAQSSYAPEAAISYYRAALKSIPSDPEYAERRLQILDGLGTMLNWQAQYEEAVSIFTQMRDDAEQVGDTMAQAQACLGISTAQIYQGDFHGATTSAEAAERIARAADLRLKIAQSIFVKGWNAFRTGEIETALAVASEVMTICEALNYEPLMAQCLNMMGGIQYTLGNYQQAGQHFARASEILQHLGDRSQAMALVNNVGAVADARGDYQAAYDGYQEALKIAREIGLRDAEMLYLSNLGGACLHLGDLLAAKRHLLQVIDMAKTTGFGQLAETYRFMAETQLGLEAFDLACDYALQSIGLAREVESPEFLAASWRALGEVAAVTGKPISLDERSYEALAAFGESLRIREETGMEGERAHTLKAWATYEINQGNLSRGQELRQEASAIFLRIGAEVEAERMRE